MEIINKLNYLLSVGDRVSIIKENIFLKYIRTKKHYGWLYLTDKSDHISVLFILGEMSNRIYLSAYAVDIDKRDGSLFQRNGLSGAWKSAVRMWPVKEEELIKDIFEDVKEKIDIAYEWHMNNSR